MILKITVAKPFSSLTPEDLDWVRNYRSRRRKGTYYHALFDRSLGPESAQMILGVQNLLAAGVDPNLVDRDGRSALMAALETQRYDCAELLISKNAVLSWDSRKQKQDTFVGKPRATDLLVDKYPEGRTLGRLAFDLLTRYNYEASDCVEKFLDREGATEGFSERFLDSLKKQFQTDLAKRIVYSLRDTPRVYERVLRLVAGLEGRIDLSEFRYASLSEICDVSLLLQKRITFLEILERVFGPEIVAARSKEGRSVLEVCHVDVLPVLLRMGKIDLSQHEPPRGATLRAIWMDRVRGWQNIQTLVKIRESEEAGAGAGAGARSWAKEENRRALEELLEFRKGEITSSTEMINAIVILLELRGEEEVLSAKAEKAISRHLFKRQNDWLVWYNIQTSFKGHPRATEAMRLLLRLAGRPEAGGLREADLRYFQERCPEAVELGDILALPPRDRAAAANRAIRRDGTSFETVLEVAQTFGIESISAESLIHVSRRHPEHVGRLISLLPATHEHLHDFIRTTVSGGCVGALSGLVKVFGRRVNWLGPGCAPHRILAEDFLAMQDYTILAVLDFLPEGGNFEVVEGNGRTFLEVLWNLNPRSNMIRRAIFKASKRPLCGIQEVHAYIQEGDSWWVTLEAKFRPDQIRDYLLELEQGPGRFREPKHHRDTACLKPSCHVPDFFCANPLFPLIRNRPELWVAIRFAFPEATRREALNRIFLGGHVRPARWTNTDAFFEVVGAVLVLSDLPGEVFGLETYEQQLGPYMLIRHLWLSSKGIPDDGKGAECYLRSGLVNWRNWNMILEIALGVPREFLQPSFWESRGGFER